MDIGLFRGLITAAVFVLFVAISLWAYSRKRVEDFADAASLPLQSDAETGMNSQEIGENLQ